MVNLVLLAENRLSLPTENRVTAAARRLPRAVPADCRRGRSRSSMNRRYRPVECGLEALGVLGGLHLAVVAMFTVTEDLVVSRRVLLRMKGWSPWRRLLAMFLPGGGRGAVYVLAQMALLLVAAWLLRPTWDQPSLVPGHVRVHLLLHRRAGGRLPAGETGGRRIVPVARRGAGAAVRSSMLLPDIFYYLLWQPAVFDLKFSARHLLNPIRTLANWRHRRSRTTGCSIPVMLGLTGVAGLRGADPLGHAHDRAASRSRSASVRRPQRENPAVPTSSIDWPAVRAAAAFRLAMPRTPIARTHRRAAWRGHGQLAGISGLSSLRAR